MEARGKYNFDALEDDELSFRKGDILKILGQHEDWCRAEMNGQEGFVPSNYIELLNQRNDDPSVGVLQKEVLLLQKEKLQLQIENLSAQKINSDMQFILLQHKLFKLLKETSPVADLKEEEE